MSDQALKLARQRFETAQTLCPHWDCNGDGHSTEGRLECCRELHLAHGALIRARRLYQLDHRPGQHALPLN